MKTRIKLKIAMHQAKRLLTNAPILARITVPALTIRDWVSLAAKAYESCSAATFWIAFFSSCQSTGLVMWREKPAAMLSKISSFMP